MNIKVKTLKWTQYPDGGLQAIGAKMERFRVHPNGRSWYLGQDYMGEGGKDAAQAWFNAAQAWFNAAILDVLEPSPDMREGLPLDRETLGRMVREAWVRWALTQPAPKPSWLVPYDEMSEPDKEADRQIGEAIAKWTMLHHEARNALAEGHKP